MRASRGAAFWGTVTCGREAQQALIRAPDSGGTPGWGGHAAWCGEQWGAACVVLLCATAFILHPAPRVLHPIPCTPYPSSCTLHPLGRLGLGGCEQIWGAQQEGVAPRWGAHRAGVAARWGPSVQGCTLGGALGTGDGDLCPGAAPGSFPHQLRGRTGPGGGRGRGRDRGAFGEAGGGPGRAAQAGPDGSHEVVLAERAAGRVLHNASPGVCGVCVCPVLRRGSCLVCPAL